jgi:glycosyltransferase involved in cell wall biosynthesis
LAVPVKDNVGSDWERLRRQALAANALPKVSVIGQTQGVATFWGIRFMAEEVMRLFDDIHKRMPFELHVIGGGKIPEPLAKMIAQPYVKIRGYVDDIAGEFLSSDVFFVPTPITLGFRTRIAEAYSYGCCVVAHRANAAGMPEMESGVNCLLGSDATSLAEGVRVCLADRQLANRLGSEARKVYESKLRGELIGNAMIQALEQVAVAAKKHRQAKASETS